MKLLSTRQRAVVAAASCILLLACDSKKVAHERLQKLSIEDHLTQRVCPSGEFSGKDAQSTIQTLPIGTYQLLYPANFLHIDAYRIHKRGDTEIVNGERKAMSAARGWVQIHALAPEMIPNFLADGSARTREGRGLAYVVEVELFWSEDGSRKPTDAETFGQFLPAEPRLAKAAESVGLVAFQKPSSSGSRMFRLTPKGSDGVDRQIFCYGCVDDRGRGRCTEIQQLRPDVCARISFSSENLACWQQVEERALRLVRDFTSGWKVRSK